MIRAGEPVMRLGGRLIDDVELARLAPPYSSICVEAGWHLLIDPGHPVRYGNHGCEPNIWHIDTVTVGARRDIAAGEELTIDYATHTGVEDWTMACACGTASCRGTIRGSDWRRKALQQRYGRHWTAALMERIVAARRR